MSEETNKVVPKLRFPEFRNEQYWEKKEFNELFEIGSGRDYKHLSKGSIPVYGSGGYMLSVDDYLYDGESVCIGRKGTINNPMFLTGKFWTVDTLFYTYSFKDCLAKFIYYVFHNTNWLSYNEAGGVPSLSKTTINKIEVYVPKPKEQQKIADSLSSLDDLITAQKQKLEALKTHKKGLMQQLFPVEGETVPKLRFAEFRESGDWEDYSVDELVLKDILFAPKDGNHGNIHPKSSDYVRKGIPFIMASNLQSGKIDFSKCAYLIKEQADSLQKGFAKSGDVLLSHKGTVCEVVLLRELEFPYIMLTPQVTYYRVKNKSKLSNEFLAAFFTSEFFQEKLKIAAGGGTRAYIGIIEQGKLKIKIPFNILEQQKIADCLSSLDETISAQKEKIEALKTHKKGLMQALFPTFTA